jgi:hypothetical protein
LLAARNVKCVVQAAVESGVDLQLILAGFKPGAGKSDTANLAIIVPAPVAQPVASQLAKQLHAN